MLWVSNQKDALDGCVGFAAQLGEGVDGGCGALGVAFEDEAFVCVFGEGVADVFYDLDMLARRNYRREVCCTSSVPPVEFWSQAAGYTVLYCAVSEGNLL